MSTHVATYSEKQGLLSTLDDTIGTLTRYVCSCGQAGQVWYADRDHARKAFHLHAQYADREPRTGATRGTGRHVVRKNGRLL